MADAFYIGNEDETITVDLLNGIFRVVDRPRLWPFLAGGDGVRRLVETFQVIGRGDYATVLGPEKAALEGYLYRLAQWHKNPILDESWWVYWNLDGESSKRSLLYPQSEIDLAPGAGMNPMGNRASLMKLAMTLERHPVYENPSAVTEEDASLSVVGAFESGCMQITNTGNLPSRIYRITIKNASSAGIYETIWLGWRPYYKGYSSFETGLDLADGTAGTDTSSSADTSAVSGAAMVCTFAGKDTLDERVKLRMSDIVLSGTESWKGRYTVLLRYKASISSASEFGIQLHYGYDSHQFNFNDEVYANTAETDYHIIELGEVELPPGELRNIVASDILTAAFKIYAERLSGSASLHLDRLILIPSEHSVKIENAYVPFGSTDAARLYTFANDETAGYNLEAGTIIGTADVDPNNFYLPVGETNGALLGICAVRQNNISDKDDTATVAVNYFPRWRSYRL